MRGWPATLIEPGLVGGAVGLRPVRARDASVWRELRVQNAAWLRPWEPTNPETPLYRSGLGPYVTMARAMRGEARPGAALGGHLQRPVRRAAHRRQHRLGLGARGPGGLLDRRGVGRARR